MAEQTTTSFYLFSFSHYVLNDVDTSNCKAMISMIKATCLFFIQYLPTSETALLFGRFTGIRGMMRGETPKCTEKTLSQCHDVHLTWTDLVTNPGLRGERLAINPPEPWQGPILNSSQLHTEGHFISDREHTPPPQHKGWKITVYTGL